MAVDVAPEMLEKVQSIFDSKVSGNGKISAIYKKLESGKTIDYNDANAFAQEVGDILAFAFSKVFTPDTLPDGRMYYNIADRVVRPMLNGNYDLISGVTEQAQRTLNAAAGINLGVKVPELSIDRVQGLVDKVSSYDDYAKAAWVLDEPVINFSQSVVDDFIKANAEFQYDVGFRPRITRILAFNCCNWCAGIAGEYAYPNVPDDFYRRHERCRCTIIYEPAKGKYQGAHSKREYADIHKAEIEERKSNLSRDAIRRAKK